MVHTFGTTMHVFALPKFIAVVVVCIWQLHLLPTSGEELLISSIICTSYLPNSLLIVENSTTVYYVPYLCCASCG